MRRIVVHPGFHKTATSSLQHALAAQADLLTPHIQMVFHKDIRTAASLARAYSETRDPLQLSAFVMEFAEFLQTCVADDPRPMVITTENLSGSMIGRKNITDYGATPDLMQAVATAVHEVLGADTGLVFYLSTRRRGWLDSCHWQLLRTERITMTSEEFAQTYAPVADLTAQVQAIRAAVHPVPVHETAVEDMNARLGPLQPLLDLLNLPADLVAKLTPPATANVKGPAALRETLRAINASDVSDGEARRQRQRLVREHRARTTDR